MSIPAPLNYAHNVAAFLKFRTGHAPTMPPDAAIITQINKHGYMLFGIKGVVVMLIDEQSAVLTSKTALTPVMSKVTPQLANIHEFIVVAILRSSHSKTNPLKALRASLEALRSTSRIVRLEATGAFAFNVLQRPAFAPRRSLVAHIRETCDPILTSEVLTEAEKNKYTLIFGGTGVPSFGNIAPLEESDPLCLWNGYVVGDIVEIQTLSMAAQAPIELRRIVPASLPKEEPTDKGESFNEGE